MSRRDRDKEESDKRKKDDESILTRLIIRILFSPLIVFVGAYYYYDQDFRKGVLVALGVYSAITAISILMKFFGVLFSAATFSPFKAIFKSVDMTFMIIVLVVFWFLYYLTFGSDLTL